MKKTFITLLFAAAASMVTQAWAGSLAGVPMKDHHLKAFGQIMNENGVPFRELRFLYPAAVS